MSALPPRPTQLRFDTPEGVPIDLELGRVGDRASAFLLDSIVVWGLTLAALLGAAVSGSGWLIALALAGTFVFRVFYFVWGEARADGATFGKRRLGLRVVRSDGGPLTIEAVLTRNFTRELETTAPLAFLAAGDHFWPGHGALVRTAAAFWMLAIPTLPLWTRLRLRLGDLVAGTRVVVSPKHLLLADLAARPAAKPNATPTPSAEIAFLPGQLGIYGIYELQVLEDVLRKADDPGGKEAVAKVAMRIRSKLNFDPAAQGQVPDRRFLEVFYAAQRKHLEQQLLFGKRKERKS